MAPLELAPPFPAIHCLPHDPPSYKSNTLEHIPMGSVVDDYGALIHQCTPYAAAVTMQPTQKAKGKSPHNNVYTARSETQPKEVLIQRRILTDFDIYDSLLKACNDLRVLKQIHARMLRIGLEQNIFLWNKVVYIYVIFGSMENARLIFDRIRKRNAFLWNVMIRGYSTNGNWEEALQFFNQMQDAGVGPDKFTFPFLLKACAGLSALEQGKEFHNRIIRSGLESDVFVGTALIDMYSKCGYIEIARQVFDKMLKRDSVSWSAMISGYGMHGHVNDVLALFSQMQQQTGMKPDHVTFIGVLSACSHAGLVDEGWQYFFCMSQDYNISPRVEHYACMVDLLGRAGRLDEAQDLIQRMPLQPDADVWGALLGACRIHCNIELGERVAKHLFDLKPEKPGSYVLLSNIYAEAGRWDDVARVRMMMKDRGLKKTPGCSFIEVHNRVHSFLVGDRSHPQSEEIYAALETLVAQMEEAGYVPDTNFELHAVEEEVKEHILYSHSEKLAIAFGLMNTSPGTIIRITKNLRVCGDCHSATKFISKIVRRKIVVRDANRFHHFEDGLCSCGDFW